MTTVWPRSQRRLQASITRRALRESRPDVGSSRKRTDGEVTISTPENRGVREIDREERDETDGQALALTAGDSALGWIPDLGVPRLVEVESVENLRDHLLHCNQDMLSESK